MTTKQANIDACPVASCDADISKAFVTTDGTKLTTENMVQDRTCLHPTTLDGEAASYIVFHDELEEGHAEPDIPTSDDADDEDEDREEEADDQDDDEEEVEPPELDTLSGNSRKVYEKIRANEPISESSLAGKCIKDDLKPTHVKGVADALHKAGHLTKEDGKYRTAKA